MIGWLLRQLRDRRKKRVQKQSQEKDPLKGLSDAKLDELAEKFMNRMVEKTHQHESTFSESLESQPTLLADIHYQDSKVSSGIADALERQFREEQKGDKYLPVFFMVGATSSTGDALGPFVGWFLKRKGFTGEYTGDLDDPVHATNIKEKVNEVWMRTMKRNKFPYIIAVDAAIGRPGQVTVNKGPLKPGAGIGKTLPNVGSIHIMGGTAHFPFMIWFTGLDQTVAMAEAIAEGLLEFWNRVNAV